MSEDTRPGDTPAERMVGFFLNYAMEHKGDFATLEEAKLGLLSAAEWAWQNESWKLVHDFWGALQLWLDCTSQLPTLHLFQDRAVVANKSLPHRESELAAALISRSDLLLLTGQAKAALADAEEGIKLAEHCRDVGVLVDGLNALANVLSEHDDKRQEVLSLLLQAWDLCKDAHDTGHASYTAYALAYSYLSLGDLEQAEKWLGLCLARTRDDSMTQVESMRNQAYAITALGAVAMRRGEHEASRAQFEAALRLKESLGDKLAITNSYRWVARLDLALGHTAEAIDLLVKTLDMLRDIEATRSVLSVLEELAAVYGQLGRYLETLELLKERMSIAQGLAEPDTSLVARVHHGLGRLHEEQQQYDLAMRAYQEAARLLEPLKEPQFFGVVLHDIADVYQALGELDQALSYYRQANEHKILSDQPADRATTLISLATLAAQLHRQDEAIDAYREALNLLNTLPKPDTSLVARVHHGLGRLHEEQQQYDLAMRAYQEAARLLEPLKEPQFFGVVLHDIADVYQALGELDQALSYYRQANEHKARGDDPGDRAATLESLARLSARLGNLDESVAAYQDALTILRALPEPPNDRIAAITLVVGELQNRRRKRTGSNTLRRNLNISFPYWHGSIEKVSYNHDKNIMYVIVETGERGLRFAHSDVVFSRAKEPPAPDESRIRRLKRTRGKRVRTLILAFPCVQGSIADVSYELAEPFLHIIFKVSDGGLSFDIEDLAFIEIGDHDLAEPTVAKRDDREAHGAQQQSLSRSVPHGA